LFAYKNSAVIFLFAGKQCIFMSECSLDQIIANQLFVIQWHLLILSIY